MATAINEAKSDGIAIAASFPPPGIIAVGMIMAVTTIESG